MNTRYDTILNWDTCLVFDHSSLIISIHTYNMCTEYMYNTTIMYRKFTYSYNIFYIDDIWQ